MSCFCDDVLIKPDGSVYHCGCADAPKIGNMRYTQGMNAVREVLDEEDEHVCWKADPRYKRRYKRLYKKEVA